MKKMNKISVVLPTYNREEKLRDSIQSVLEQTYKELELVVVDDGSTDGTQEMIHTIKDDRLRFIKLNENKGVSNARNEGVNQSESDWIAFQDSDDIWRPEKLERQIDYWEKHRDCSLIYSAYLYHGADGINRKVPGDMLQGELEGDIFPWLLERNSIGTPTVLVKKDAFLMCGGFDIDFRSLEDWDFTIRFSKKNRIAYLPEVLVDAGASEGGISSATGAYYESRCRMIGKYKQELLERGIFERAVEDILLRAKGSDVLDKVERILTIFLQ